MKNQEIKYLYLGIPIIVLFMIVILLAIYPDFSVAKLAPVNQLAKTPLPITSCDVTDITQRIIGRLPNQTATNITELIRLDDKDDKYFIVTTEDVLSNSREKWIYSTGADGIFSMDDTAIKVPRQEAIPLKATGDNQANEKLYFIRNQIGNQFQFVESCNFSSCVQTNTELTWSGRLDGVIEVNNRIVLSGFNNLIQNNGIFSCSLISTDIDWCGSSQSSYITHTLGRSVGSSPVREEGLGGYGAFFDARRLNLINIPSGTTREIYRFSNSLLLFLERRSSQSYYLTSLDTANNFYSDITVLTTNAPATGIVANDIGSDSQNNLVVTYALWNGRKHEIYKKEFGSMSNQETKLAEISDEPRMIFRLNDKNTYLFVKDVLQNNDEGRLLKIAC